MKMIKWVTSVAMVASVITAVMGQQSWATEVEKTTAVVKAIKTVEKLPIESFTRLSSAKNLQISPDGKHLSMIIRRNNEDVLTILDSTSLKAISAFRVRGENRWVGDVHWVNDERVVYSVTANYGWDKSFRNTGELYAANVDGKKHEVIFGHSAGNEGSTGTHLQQKKSLLGSNEILDVLPDDPKNILLAFYPWTVEGNMYVVNDNVLPVLYYLNTYTGKTRRVGELARPLDSGLVDNKHEVRLSYGYDVQNNLVMNYRKTADDDWQPLTISDIAGIERYWPIGFTADDQGLYLNGSVKGETSTVYRYNLHSKTTEKLYNNKTVDIFSWFFNYSGSKLIGVSTDLGLPEYHYIDKDDAKAILHRKMMATFKGSDIDLTSETKDGKKVVVKVSGDNNPGDYYIYDHDKKNVHYLISSRDWIYPEQMATSKGITVKARDGLLLNGYLTKPVGLESQLPMVVLPHGGPHGVRDYWGFDWQVQLLANQGFAVLQLNYRGSNGFGDDFEKAGHGNWGTTMQDDLTDATLAMIEQGVADKKRICLFGESYGGYAALMGAVKAPDLYRCVIGSAGVYDLPMMFKKGDISENQRGLNYLKEVLGENQQDLVARSPAHNAAKISAAVLLVHGGEDERAPIEQAESMKAALTKAGKPFEYLAISNEAHGYYDEKNRAVVYGKIVEFLQQHIGQ